MLRWKPPHAEVVRRRQAQRERQLPRSPRAQSRAATRPRSIWEGEPGDRRTLTYWDLYRQVGAFANVLKSLGVKTRRSRRALPAADSRARDRDARVRAHRRGPQRGLRRLQRGVAARSHQRRAGACCSSPPTAAIAAARSCRSSRWPTRRSRDTPSIQNVVVVQRQAGAPIPVDDAGGPRPLVPPPDAGRVADVRARGDGRRGHALHPLHVGHDRESRRASSTRPAATSSAPTPRRSGSSISRKTTSTGARPTSAGSPATATSSTARSPTARPS